MHLGYVFLVVSGILFGPSVLLGLSNDSDYIIAGMMILAIALTLINVPVMGEMLDALKE